MQDTVKERRPSVVPATAETILDAARRLRAGALVAFPTETVYGLGADATDDRAVAAIFAAKDRPRFNPLIVHVPNAVAATREAVFDARAERLAAAFWPGPLTLVLPRRADSALSLLVSAGLDTVALRVPGHTVAHALLNATGRPIAAPSANRAGEISPTEAAHVAASLGDRVALILDGGRCPVGVESTVVDLSRDAPLLLRPGGVTREALEAVIGTLGAPEAAGDGPARSPGLIGRHYAPGRPLRLDVRSVGSGREALLAFGPTPLAGFAATLNLSPSGDLVEAAANLFAMLRALDRSEHEAIAVMPVPDEGLGLAINDRLRRAALAACPPLRH
jgi:L-threonylcarbamoyladenylate synthase